MRGKSVTIAILTNRIDVVVVKSGEVQDARRIPITLGSDTNQWIQVLRRAVKNLSEAVAELDAMGAPATVLYRSPTQVVDLSSAEIAATAEACDAAILSCTDTLPYSASSALCEAMIVGSDHSGDTRKSHVVVAAERSDVVDTLVELMKGAGLTFHVCLPMDAAIIGRMIAGALTTRDCRHCWLYIGEHSSFCLGVSDGTLRFGRRIGVGLHTLITSLTRPIRVADQVAPIELDENTAAEVFYGHGVAGRNEIVLDSRGLTGEQVLPLMQPVLQRYLVELRQSLRFGLSEEERSAIAITVTGPGSCVPGLTELLSTELDIQVTADPGHASYDFSAPGSPGSEMADAVEDPEIIQSLALLPQDMRMQRAAQRFRRWLTTGAAIAALAIGIDTFRMKARVADARTKAEGLQAQAEANEALTLTRNRVMEAIGAMNGLETGIHQEVGDRVNLRGTLRELAVVTPKDVRLSSITLFRREAGYSTTLEGYAFKVQEEQAEQSALERYIEQLRMSPLLHDVLLGNVSVGQVAGTQCEHFTAEFMPVLTPGGPIPEEALAQEPAEGGP